MPAAVTECTLNELLVLAQNAEPGDNQAFNEYTRRSRDGLVSLISRRNGDAHVAEDIVQAAMCKLWLAVRDHTWDSSIDKSGLGYVSRAANQEAIAYYRKWRRRQELAPTQSLDEACDVRSNAVNPAFAADQTESVGRLQRVLAAFPEAQRKAVLDYYVADLSMAQIVAELGIKRTTVRRSIHTAILALSKALQAPPAGL